jgi:hypothetical protein
MFIINFVIATNWDMPNKNIKYVEEDVATSNSSLRLYALW